MDQYYEFNYGEMKKHKKMIMFDLDFTLIKPNKGKFAKNENDWIWLYGETTREKLLKISKNKNIVIVSNQNGIKNNEQLEKFKKKIENIYNDIKIPFTIYIMTLKNEFRKPNTKIWSVIYDKFKISIDKTIYVGDAAGRTDDFSDSDLKFAENLKIKFYTPEQYFMNEQKGGEIINKKFEINYYNHPTFIMLMGPPATGKSTFYSNNLSEYSLYSQDIYKTKAKLVKELLKDLLINKTVVIEGLLYTKEMREHYISIGKSHNYKIHLIFLNNDINKCKKNNDNRVNKVPGIVYSKYIKYFEEPTENENIDKIDVIQTL